MLALSVVINYKNKYGGCHECWIVIRNTLRKLHFFLKYLTAIADLYKSVKRVDPSCFIAVDNRDTVIQWLTDGELAASSS